MSATPEVQALKVHVSINVRNVERSIDFYRRMLGVEPSKVRTGYAKFDVHNPLVNLALNEVPDLAGPGAILHLGIQVGSTDDVLATCLRWERLGLVTRDEMQTSCSLPGRQPVKTMCVGESAKRWKAHR